MKFLVLLLTILVGMTAYSGECPNAKQVCDCHYVCEAYPSRQSYTTSTNFLNGYGSTPVISLVKQHRNAQAYLFCNTKNTRDCVTVYR
jgi:hypothetical protein